MDVRTLILATTFSLLVTSAAVILGWLANRRVYGVDRWSLGFLLMAFGVFLHSFQGALPPLFSIASANTLLCAGFFITWSGARAFQRRSPTHAWQLGLVLALVIGAHALFGLGPEGFVERAVTVSCLIGLLGLLVAREMLISPTGIRPFTDTLSGLLYLALGVSFLLRGLYAPFIEAVRLIVDENPYNFTTFLMALVFNVVIAFANLVLLTERHNARQPRLVDTDPATGLYNASGLAQAGQRLFLRRTPALARTFLLIELPWLATLRRERGAAVEEEVLERWVALVNRTFREQDLVGQLRPGRFAACMSLREARDAERIRARLAEAVAVIARDAGVADGQPPLFSVLLPVEGPGDYAALLREARARLRQQMTQAALV